MFASSKTRTQPSHYPPLAFHAIRTCCLASSLVVAAILSYFVYHLKHDNFKIPWTFLVVSSLFLCNVQRPIFDLWLQLFGVALLSLLTLILTFALHCCHVLSPLFSLILNIPVLLLWVFGLSLLGWNMAGTLGHVCNTANWGSEVGIMICRLYKTLFTFALLGAISAFAMVALDVKVRRKQTRMGKYNQMRESAYDSKPLPEAFSSDAPRGHRDDDPEPWQSTGQELDDYNTAGGFREHIKSQHFGYTSPAEQTQYDAWNYGARERLRTG